MGIKGFVSKREHYFRNYLNRVPATLSEMEALNATLPKDQKWILLPVGASVYHMYETGFSGNGVYNLKFISADGMYEAVYNGQGQLCTEKTDPVNMGTFNYHGDYTGPVVEKLNDLIAHGTLDVLPYDRYGNTPVNGTPPKGASIQINKDRYDSDSDAQKYRDEFLDRWKGDVG